MGPGRRQPGGRAEERQPPRPVSSTTGFTTQARLLLVCSPLDLVQTALI